MNGSVSSEQWVSPFSRLGLKWGFPYTVLIMSYWAFPHRSVDVRFYIKKTAKFHNACANNKKTKTKTHVIQGTSTFISAWNLPWNKLMALKSYH